MSNFFKRQNVNLDNIFQLYSSANATQAATLASTATRYTNNNIDIASRYAGRDNRTSNWVSQQTFYRIFGSDISNNFNRFGAQFIITIGGNYTYDKIAKTPTLSYSPTNVVVPNISTRTDAGTYACSTVNTTSAVAVGTNIPATYVPVRSGSMIINPRPITFTFSGSATYTGNPFNVTNFITVGGGLPAGVGYTVSPSTVVDVGTYNNSSFTITITGDSASNYSITKSGSFTITQLAINLNIFGEQEYSGFSYFPSYETFPSGYESVVSFGNNAINVGDYGASYFSPFSTNPNIIFNNITGTFTIFTRLIVSIFFPGIAMYVGPSTAYLPSVNSVTSLTGAPIPIDIVNNIYPTTPKTYPGYYDGYTFGWNGFTNLYRQYQFNGAMQITNFSGTTDLTQNVNGTGTPGSTINLVTQSVSPSLPSGVSYNASISDPGPTYPKYLSGSSASLSITGDNPSYYNITQTGTISVLSSPF